MPNEKNKIAETALYDKLFREISPIFLTVFVEKVLGLDIVEYTELKDKLQMTRQKETDTLRKVTDRNGDTFILHLEIQRKNESNMAIQMADYWILLHQLYKLPIRQYVLYIGPERMNMPDRLDLPNFSFRYTLMSFSDLPYDLFINAEQTEIKMLAILGNLGNADAYEVTESIVRAIDREKAPVSEKQKRINQLRIIAQLRKFTPQLEKAMLKAASFFKEERDPFYKRGEAKGIEKERAKAEAEKLAEKRKIALEFKNLGVSIADIAKGTGLSIEEVEKL
ncbi:RpnC/YadD family protein [Parapedobacter koreensis]|uniref:Transposase (putative) YhgA-like domain-containing protein n=1 Tax=Parapedobacter koreensis TaxID=332977 RepID=A0A1H7PZG2_9SPHI|nr:hypothetical protein [Parapedobacter koreensis]SEL41220.1 conserved hypothetical protein (putative transposase or invertase) [Parapedobacter koreensis]